MTRDARTRPETESDTEFNTGTEFDLEKYQAEHKPPSRSESAFITIIMFLGLCVFAVGCWALIGWG